MKGQVTQTTDPRTGEIIKRCAIPEEFQKQIEEVLQEHQGALNQFMMMSQQLADLQAKWMEFRQSLNKSDNKIKDKMKYCCKKLQLEAQQPWTYHLVDKCFELREPPEIKPLTPEEVVAHQGA